MPGLAAHRNDQLLSNASNSLSSYYSLSSNNGSVSSSSNGFWSKHRDDISYNQLQKFWSELSPHARQSLLRIDKHTLFEQARKNMYCSRCNGLLLEGFMQIVMYGKSLQLDGATGQQPLNKLGISKDQINGGPSNTSVCQDETQDPSVHPWGGLTTTRDGALTLLDCYLYSKSLKGLQNVFDSARARERERELLYPDACGGGGRGWISQGIASYGRGHGTRETCALHTARLSCETLVDFWSALGEETRQSLLRMKEEDFIERLMYRFDSKRFCRDCRRNVIREFKELKELKRMRKEPRCTSWFCVADTAFQYEVSNDAIHADWHQTFIDSIGTYHHFEWAVGSGEGKSDIVDFENVGMNGSVQVNGLDLGGLNACYITLRAWKLDGRCTEFSVKAHALKGRRCVHCRLIVGDGYVTITRGESISKFFEHAEEAEEEEDDDSMDKDGNDMDGLCSRPQKHAKSPELAREFLLEAAVVIFKEQVEKAFREENARRNALGNFVSLALKLLEKRIYVACKEIITLEKQMKLLEEEDKEKREEEERKERKRTKEREKKLRRKERLRGKDKDRKCSKSSQTPLHPYALEEVLSSCFDEEANNSKRGSASENSDTPGVLDELCSDDYMATASVFTKDGFDSPDGELGDVKEGDGFSSPKNNKKGSLQRSIVQGDLQLETSLKWSDRCESTEKGVVGYKSESRHYGESLENHLKGVNWLGKQSRANASHFHNGSGCLRPNQKVQYSNIRTTDRNNHHLCGSNHLNDYREKAEPHSPVSRFSWVNRSAKSSVNGRCESVFRLEARSLYHEEMNNEIVDVTPCSLNETSDFCASCCSSSDNCSSCFSEGESNAPSSSNVESSSTSDSEDSSQQSEVRDSPMCVQNGLSKTHDIEKEKIKNIIVEESACFAQSSSFSPQNVGSHIHRDFSTKISSQNIEEANIAPGLVSVQHGIVPPFYDPNISFPILQSPTTMGYYPQTPIAWSAAPPDGFLTSPHPCHYLSSSPFGYGLSGGDSTLHMQYGPVDHLASYTMSPNHIPQHQQAPRSNCLDPLEQTNALKASRVTYPSGESRTRKVDPIGCDQTVVQPIGAMEKGNLTKLDSGNTGFSLFQFGGPVALPAYRSNLLFSDEGKSGDESCRHVKGGRTCSKEDTSVEEYSLFAPNNGIQFQFSMF